jgi:hypothetical protein
MSPYQLKLQNERTPLTTASQHSNKTKTNIGHISPPGGALICLETIIPSPHPTRTTIEPILLIAPPKASDVRELQNVSQTIPAHKAPSLNHMHPHHCKAMPDELQQNTKTFCTELNTTSLSVIGRFSGKQQHSKRTQAPITGGGFPKGLKRRSTVTRTPGSCPHTISRLTELLATYTNEQYTKIIEQLPEGRSAMNDRGTKVTKRQLEMAQ